VMRDFPIRLDGASKVALFAYDNNSFIMESYLPTATDVKVSVVADFKNLRNLVTGEILAGEPALAHHWRGRPVVEPDRTVFNVHLQPHSYAVFSAEK